MTLALRSGAAVVPMLVVRDAEDRLTLRISSEIDLVKTGDLQEDLAANLVLFTRHLEGIVRRYPDQWSQLSPKTAEQNLGPMFPDFGSRGSS